jgi:branched-chain amino acid transport system ATP-binding protein
MADQPTKSANGPAHTVPLDRNQGSRGECELAIDGLTAGYGELDVLHDVSLRVGVGESVAVLGANGAGKTTLLRAISGLLRPRAGVVAVNGRDVVGTRADEILRLGIAHVPQDRQIFTELTVEDNLLLGQRLRTDRDGIAADKEKVLAVFPALAERRRERAGNLSGGQQQMLAIARAVMARPKLLLLDEPTAGLAPRLVDEMTEMIGSLLDGGGMGLLLVEQDAALALELTTRALVLRDGRIVKRAASADLDRDGDLVRAYLGDDAGAAGLGAV